MLLHWLPEQLFCLSVTFEFAVVLPAWSRDATPTLNPDTAGPNPNPLCALAQARNRA